jgi:tRNA-dihydrouridine synthase B
MLAPMQGLTNRGLRAVFARTAQPDVLFTEFVRISAKGKGLISDNDFVEATATTPGIPLVVQVIGCLDEGVIEATQQLVDRGVEHINVNMGCPFGRMTSVLAGGGMFKSPETIEPMLSQMRKLVPGSLSVKTRTGIDDERQLLALLPFFENAGVDFLIVHSRTVQQKYRGHANHDLTRELVESTRLPLIANGDIANEVRAAQILESTGAAGLMLGRGAIADPRLFQRIRGHQPKRPTGPQYEKEFGRHLRVLLAEYDKLFCGDAQVLAKMKETLVHVKQPDVARFAKKLLKRRTLSDFRAALAQL